MRLLFSHHDRFCSWAACGACLALLAAATQLAAQNPTLKTRTKEDRERAYMQAHRITINVQVSDGAGKLVPDLAAADFTLIDNDQPRKISGVHLIDGEVMTDATEVIIVLDAVNSTAQELQEDRQAIFDYLAHGHGPLPYPTSFALWFNGHLKPVGATTDRNALGRAFVGMTKNVHSNACSDAPVVEGSRPLERTGTDVRTGTLTNCLEVHFRDSIAALDGIAQQQRTIGGRTIVIWMGPGWPLPTDAEFEQTSSKAKADFFEESVNLLRALRDSQVTLDAVAPVAESAKTGEPEIHEKELGAGSYAARNDGPRSLALPALATETGGRVLTASRDEITDLNSCIRDAGAYYAILFEAMPATSRHELHRIEVKVNRPGVDVRTMTAYYAEP